MNSEEFKLPFIAKCWLQPEGKTIKKKQNYEAK